MCDEQRGADLAAHDAPDRPHDRVHARRDARFGGPDGLGDQRRHRREGEADADAEHCHRAEDLP